MRFWSCQIVCFGLHYTIIVALVCLHFFCFFNCYFINESPGGKRTTKLVLSACSQKFDLILTVNYRKRKGNIIFPPILLSNIGPKRTGLRIWRSIQAVRNINYQSTGIYIAKLSYDTYVCENANDLKMLVKYTSRFQCDWFWKFSILMKIWEKNQVSI